METEVAKESRGTMKKHIQNDAYSQYAPTSYVRKYDQGGLIDDSNIETIMIDDNTLKVENIRKDEETGRLVTPVVEYGKGYYTDWLDKKIGPRPFVNNTFIELKNGVAKEALKEGLRKQGVDVE